MAATFLADHGGDRHRPRLFVRINAFASGFAEADLDAVMPGHPDGIMLPKCAGGADVQRLSAMIAAREALAGHEDGATEIIVLATETPAALFTLGTYAGVSQRLIALTWGAEDLSAALGAEANRDSNGMLTHPYRLARSLCLFGAAAASVAPIDAVFTAFRDLAALEKEAIAARRDGFAGKLAIHPDQVPVINRVFTPSREAVTRARAVLDAFAAAGDAGVVSMDGQMFDQPHRAQAERVLARAKAAGFPEGGG